MRYNNSKYVELMAVNLSATATRLRHVRIAARHSIGNKWTIL